jgi:hypothetical protein
VAQASGAGSIPGDRGAGAPQIGRDIFGTSEVENGIMIFAAFFLCQVFNLFNAREIERKNVFASVLRNWMFLTIVAANTWLISAHDVQFL